MTMSPVVPALSVTVVAPAAVLPIVVFFVPVVLIAVVPRTVIPAAPSATIVRSPSVRSKRASFVPLLAVMTIPLTSNPIVRSIDEPWFQAKAADVGSIVTDVFVTPPVVSRRMLAPFTSVTPFTVNLRPVPGAKDTLPFDWRTLPANVEVVPVMPSTVPPTGVINFRNLPRLSIPSGSMEMNDRSDVAKSFVSRRISLLPASIEIVCSALFGWIENAF